MQLTYLGQSGFFIQTKGFNIIIDPFVIQNPLAKNINLDNLKADYILLTHGHDDHVADAEHIARESGATIISNFEIVSWYQAKGLKGHPMNHGGQWKFDFGTVKYVNAVHSSALPDNSYGGSAGGFVIWNDEASIYFAGDTALTWDMKLIPMTCPTLDLAVLPIGDNFTMGYSDAVIAADFVQCDKILGCHFDTFGYIEIDHDTAVSEFKNAGKELILLKCGASLEI
jgi:L-ascorbate metabolism protein UlaG (beta-lactamase superfamily)